MRTRIIPLLIGIFLWLGAIPARALDFYLDLVSHTQAGVTSYLANVRLEADFNDFDELVDGFEITSPGGDLSVIVTTDFLSDDVAMFFPNFTAMTGAIYGNWTLDHLVLGFPFDSETFRVQSAGLAAADLPTARVLSPAFDSTGVSPTPVITFSGPANATGIAFALQPESGSYPNEGFALLPGGATQYTPPFPLSAGNNQVFVLYYLPEQVPAKVTIGAPSGVAWSSLVSRAANAASRFSVGGAELRLLGPELVSGQFRWSFATEAGRTYDVEFNDHLGTANWQVLQTINGDGSVKSFSVSPDQGARFFRLARR